MAKFCTKCGAKLVDGACPNCKDGKEQMEEKKGMTFQPEEIINTIKGMFTKPIDTMKEVIEGENVTLSLIFLGINALFIALFCCLGSKELFGAYTNQYSYFMIERTVDIPYARIFFTSFVTVIATYVVIAGLFYLIVDKLFQGKTTFQKMIAYLGISSVIVSATMIVTMIFMYVSTQLMLLFLMCGLVLSSVYMIQGFRYTTEIDKNYVGYVYALVYLVVFIITMFIIPNIFQ